MARPAGDYRRTLVIDHTKVTGTLSDYELMVRITGSDATALLGKMRWDGQDAVLTAADGETVIPHVRHYAGKAVATDAAQTWYTEPRAFHYAGHGAGGVTYIGIVGSDGNTAVVAHDHSTGLTTFRKLSNPGLDDHTNPTVHVTGTGRLLAATWNHGTGNTFTHQRWGSTTGDLDATITATTVTMSGYSLCGYPSYYSLTSGASGPAERVMCFFYAVPTGSPTARDLFYTYSDDDGGTWSTPTKYATAGANYAYVKHVSDGATKIHMGITDYHPNYVSSNKLYHMAFESSAGTIKFYKSDATEITAGLPFDAQTEATVVYDSAASNLTYGTGALNWISGIELDGSSPKRPAIVFGVYPGATGPLNSVAINDSRYVRALWNTTSWDLTEICRGGDNLPYSPGSGDFTYYGGVCLKQGDPTVAYVSTNYNTRTALTNDGPHEVQQWTYSGGWSKTADVTSGSGKGATAPFTFQHFRPVWARNAHADAQVIWCSGRYANYTDYFTSINSHPTVIGEPIVYLTAKVPSINDATDMTLYLYYGALDVAADSQAAASSVLAATTKLFLPGGDYPPDSSKIYEIANGWRPPKNGALIANPREVENGGGSKFFRAMKLDGAADLPNNALFAAAISNSAKAFTLMGWVKFADVGATYGRQTILHNYASSAGLLFRLRCFDGTASTASGAGHRLEGFTIDSGGTPQGGQFFIGQTNISANTWYHVALTFNESDSKLRCYLNGVEAAETYTNATWHATASVAGQWGSDGTNYISPNSMFERMRFYSGDATACLSAGLIATNYQNESAPEAFAVLGAEGPGPASGGAAGFQSLLFQSPLIRVLGGGGMSYKPNDSLTEEFITSSGTGAAVDADSLPTAALVKNGTDDGAVTLTVANVDTGRYKVTGTIPSGYAAGDKLQIALSATVGGVAAKAIMPLGVLDSKRNADLNDFNPVATTVNANVTQWGGTNVATANVSGVPIVDIGYVTGTVATASSGALDANVTKWSGTNVATPDTAGHPKVTIKSGTGAGEISLVSGAVSTVTTVTNLTNAPTVGDLTATMKTSVTTAATAATPIAASVAGNVGGSVASVTAGVTVSTNNDKTGYGLASDGLDSVAITEPSGVASDFREMVVAVWRSIFKKSTLTATQLKYLKDDGTTAAATQTVSDDGTTQTRGAAS